MSIEENYPLTWRYQRYAEESGFPKEEAADYVTRMQSGPLPNWPDEPLREWLYRHPGCMEDYAFLGFERFQFTKEIWNLSQIPGREAFRDERFCDSFSDIEERAAQEPADWLARHMLIEGTWNTPIILLENQSGAAFPCSRRLLKSPYHLLEGHRRLSLVQGLRRLNKARPQHPVWMVRLPQP